MLTTCIRYRMDYKFQTPPRQARTHAIPKYKYGRRHGPRYPHACVVLARSGAAPPRSTHVRRRATNFKYPSGSTAHFPPPSRCTASASLTHLLSSFLSLPPPYSSQANGSITQSLGNPLSPRKVGAGHVSSRSIRRFTAQAHQRNSQFSPGQRPIQPGCIPSAEGGEKDSGPGVRRDVRNFGERRASSDPGPPTSPGSSPSTGNFAVDRAFFTVCSGAMHQIP